MPYPDQIPDATMAEISRRLTWGINEQRVLDTPVGESVFDRTHSFNGTALTSQDLSLVGFTARATQTISQIKASTATTAAGATPSLVRFGVYVRDTSNNYTLIASTANDTTVFAAASTIYTRSFSASFVKTLGEDYLVANLVVSAAAMPTLVAPTSAVTTAWSTNAHIVQPIICGKIAAQADLPTSFAGSSVVASAGIFQALLLA